MTVFDTIPPQGPPKPGQLTKEQLHHFFDKGYLLLDNVFTDSDLAPMKADIDLIVEDIANRLFAAGKISDKAEDAPHGERLSRLEEQFQGATILVHRAGSTSSALEKIWTNPRLLNIMEQMIGPDIIGHPVWNIRPKAPQASAYDVPWHQDNAYLDSSVDNVLQVTAWIPLLDTNPTNGCLELLPEAHKANKVGEHEGLWGNTWYLFMHDEETATLGVPLDQAITVDVPYGSVLLFNNLLPHRSLPNLSKTIRWSLDLRWQDGNEPVGFHGVKEGIWFRKGGEDVPPDWDKFNAVDRQKVPGEKLPTIESETLINPHLWLKRWKLSRTNRHSEAANVGWHGI